MDGIRRYTGNQIRCQHLPVLDPPQEIEWSLNVSFWKHQQYLSADRKHAKCFFAWNGLEEKEGERNVGDTYCIEGARCLDGNSWDKNFLSAVFGICYKISRDKRFKLSKHHSGCGLGPKNNCGMREMTWSSRRIRDPYTPIRSLIDPVRGGRSGLRRQYLLNIFDN